MFQQLRTLSSVLVLIVSLTSVAGCGGGGSLPSAGSQAEQTTISVSGAFALFPLMTVWVEEYQQLHPEVRFDVQAGGAGKGMTDMLAGAADIAMLSREPRQEELDQAAYPVPVTIDSVLATVNANNPYLAELRATGLTPAKGAGIWFDGSAKTWGDLLGNGATEPIHPYTRADAAGAAEMWARYLGGKAQEELQGTAVNGDPGLAEAVRQDALGIGFNNVGFAYNPATGEPIAGLAIVPLDVNEDGQITPEEDFYGERGEVIAAVAQGHYPFPPARVLYLVTKDAPSPAVKDFYTWVLNEGQQVVEPAGYVALNAEQLAEAKALIEP